MDSSGSSRLSTRLQIIATSGSTTIGAFLTVFLVSFVGIAFYKVFLHPLRRFPGPKLWAISNIPWNYYNLRLRLPFELHALHEKYGPVVRIGPNQLSYSSAASWKEIYSGAASTSENLKDLHQGFGLPHESDPKEWPMTVSDTPKHRRIRRALLPAFSEHALRDQAPLIKEYVDLLILRLREGSVKGPEDIITWVNRFTFDALGHFCFGQSFNALQDSKTPDLVGVLVDAGTYIPISQFAMQYGLRRVLSLLVPAKALNLMESFNQLATTQVLRVIEQMKSGAASSGLFFSYLGQEQDEKSKISEKEAIIEGRMLLVAGAETTTSAISGSLFYLCRHPSAYQKIVKEIRSTFSSEDEMTNEALAALKYTNAVLKETFRIYPPVPGAIPRVAPAGGARIFGQFVPANTIIGVAPYATNRSPRNFHLPDQFFPERWLAKGSNEPENDVFLNDKLEASQPFSYGPRICLGKSLAWLEVRLLLTQLLWNFDFEIALESEGWMDAHLASVPWVKPELMLNIKPVTR